MKGLKNQRCFHIEEVIYFTNHAQQNPSYQGPLQANNGLYMWNKEKYNKDMLKIQTH